MPQVAVLAAQVFQGPDSPPPRIGASIPARTGVFRMKFVIPVVFALALGGCISFQGGYHAIKTGMSASQVKQAMRSCPNLSVTNGLYSSMTYLGQMPDFFQLSSADYTFVFKDDVLVEFGEGAAANTTVTGAPAMKLVPPVSKTAELATKIPPAVCTS